MGRKQGGPGGGGPPKDWAKSNPKHKTEVKLSKHARRKMRMSKKASFTGGKHLSARWDSAKMNRAQWWASRKKARQNA